MYIYPCTVTGTYCPQGVVVDATIYDTTGYDATKNQKVVESRDAKDTMEVSAPLAVATGADAAECVTWKYASKLGTNHENAPLGADEDIHLAAHRWAWFAGADRAWRALFERHVQSRLDEHMGLYLEPGEDDAWYAEVWEALHCALWEDGGNLSALKKRACEHFQRGIKGCREKCAAPPPTPPG